MATDKVPSQLKDILDLRFFFNNVTYFVFLQLMIYENSDAETGKHLIVKHLY